MLIVLPEISIMYVVECKCGGWLRGGGRAPLVEAERIERIPADLVRPVNRNFSLRSAQLL